MSGEPRERFVASRRVAYSSESRTATGRTFGIIPSAIALNDVETCDGGAVCGAIRYRAHTADTARENQTMSTSHDPSDPDDLDHDTPTHREPGGPYFGRLLVVLLLAVAFCGFMTWYLGSVMVN